MGETALRVDGVGKLYRLGQSRYPTSLRESINSAFAASLRQFRRANNDSYTEKSNPEIGDARPPDHIWALKDVSFEIERGETVGIIGPNGSGKSTLLKILAEITEPTEGEIYINGRLTALIELGAGFHPELSGRENIYLNGAILGLSKDDVDAKLDQIIEFADLKDFVDTPVKRYSSGMYVRLGFSIAASVDSDIILVDEVLAVGDAQFKAKCFAKFRELKRLGKTIIIVSHDLALISDQCSRAILVFQGKTVESGTPKKVVDRYQQLVSLRRDRNSYQKGETYSLVSEYQFSSANLEWQGAFKLNPTGNRYGTKQAEIIEIGVFDLKGHPSQILERNLEYLIRIKVRFHENMAADIVSYVIKDAKGNVLCGTNTQFQQVDMGQMVAGDTVVVTFTQVMRLNSGEYLLSVGVDGIEDGRYVAHDRWLDCLPFQVLAREQRHGLFDLESSIHWRHCVSRS
jgi:teichoic acid transport system ATP-binding protein